MATADIGRVAAELLTAEDAPALVELAGPRDETPRTVAAAFAAALGREVVPPREAWEGFLREAGLGEEGAGLLAAMYDGINAGRVRFSCDVPLSRGLIGIARTVPGFAPAAAA